MENKIKSSQKKIQLNLFDTDDNSLNKEFFIFRPNRRLFIANTPDDIDSECYCNGDTWSFPVNGRITKINWLQYRVAKPLLELLKGFIFRRLQNRASSTVLTDMKFLNSIAKFLGGSNMNFNDGQIISLLQILNRQTYYSFKFFYKWCLQRQFNGFSDHGFQLICEYKVQKYSGYAKVAMRQFGQINQKIIRLVNTLDTEEIDLSVNLDNLCLAQKRVLLRLCLELAPRPSQIYYLNHSDLVTYSTQSNAYHSIKLPMAKKMSEKVKEKRLRAVSVILGETIAAFIKIKKAVYKTESEDGPLFINPKSQSILSSVEIGAMIRKELKFINLNATDMRHNLAQGLADQGASADVIADILGHNSTLPAKAYIAATPKISEIKAKALGMNNNYKNIMHMLNTGKIINRNGVQKETWIKGMVGFQYIGEIGACSLNSSCPKNPVYSCYSCKKFNPFNDGEHLNVLKGLEDSVQMFLDSSTAKKDIQHNRTVVQLESTIEAVKKVIDRINLKK